MNFYQSFEWKPNLREVWYRYALIDIVLELRCWLAVFENSPNEQDTTVQFAINYPSESVLVAFKECIGHRMSFTNWQPISAYDFRGYYLGFSRNSVISKSPRQFSQFLQKIVGFSEYGPNLDCTLIVPFSEDNASYTARALKYHHNTLIPKTMWGHQATILQVKQLISDYFAQTYACTYFQHKYHWDAKIANRNQELIIRTYLDPIVLDMPTDFSLEGDADLMKQFTQSLANICGAMILDSCYHAPIIIEPQWNNPTNHP